MSRSGVVSALFLFLCLTAALSARGGKEKSAVIEATGTVRLVGSDPFYEVVITGPETEWYIAREEQRKLKDLQYSTVTVKGEETVVNLTFANGYPAGERRTLKNIKILRTEQNGFVDEFQKTFSGSNSR